MALEDPSPGKASGFWMYLFVAWCIALISSLAVLFIGEIMGQAPCLLCWFQRAFMFPLAVVLGVACFRSDAGAWAYALPLAGLGWFVAIFHSLQYVGLVPEAMVQCGTGPSCVGSEMNIFGGLPLPLLSMGTFAAIILLLIMVRKGSTK